MKYAINTSKNSDVTSVAILRNTLGSQLDEMMGSLDDVVKRKENSEDVFEPIVKRKHRRKGTPYRSPFY
ncbi:unnamed protein product [Brassica napus]|uniref:(rape) hypothetical protein n=1 Tax=Brassica napus TaxID=3708 RepID=A0A816PBW4_BRANA|nr:unnamed protein product [Brassica napus]